MSWVSLLGLLLAPEVAPLTAEETRELRGLCGGSEACAPAVVEVPLHREERYPRLLGPVGVSDPGHNPRIHRAGWEGHSLVWGNVCRRNRFQVAQVATLAVRKAFAAASLNPAEEPGDSLLFFLAPTVPPQGAARAVYQVRVDLGEFPRVAPAARTCRVIVSASLQFLTDPPRRWQDQLDPLALSVAARVQDAVGGLR